MSLEEDARWLDWVTNQFQSIAGDDQEIDLEEFKTALKVKDVSRAVLLSGCRYYRQVDPVQVVISCFLSAVLLRRAFLRAVRL